MSFDYIMLLLVSFLPILYKLLFWLYVFQLKDYRIDRLRDYFSTSQWKNAIFNFWFLIEIPVFILSFTYLIYSPLEYILFNLVFYFLLLQNIFVLWKVFRKRIFKPKLTSRLLLLISVYVLLLSIIYNFIWNYIYVFIMLCLVFTPLILWFAELISYPIVIYKKSKIIKKAINISNKKNHPIKIWITWSYWKSSIKSYLSQILSENNKVLYTPKNINTDIWVAIYIIKNLKNKFKYFVAEMWAYKIWEISLLWKIVNHKYWFLTAIWNQHLSLFWSIENTMKWKSEIAEKVLENNGKLYINWNNKLIKKIDFDKNLDIVRYWTKNKCDAKSEIIEIKNNNTVFNFYYKWLKDKYKTNLIWTHNIINITWILAFLYDIWFEKKVIKEKLLKLANIDNTMEFLEDENNMFINDTYNLSEWWLFAWLETLNLIKSKYLNKVLVIDDILELWDKSNEIHFEIWKKIAKKKLADKIIYTWINYKSDFIKWLISWWFKISNIINNLDFVTNSIILLEWRKSKTLLNKYYKWKK